VVEEQVELEDLEREQTIPKTTLSSFRKYYGVFKVVLRQHDSSYPISFICITPTPNNYLIS